MATKLGPHAILTTGPGLAWARRAPIVKQVDRLELLRAAPAWAYVIYRRYWSDQGYVLRQGGAWAAQMTIQDLQGFRHPKLYVEGMNETCQRLGHGLEEYVAWTQQFAAECHNQGVKVAGFSFSTGCPERDDWLYIQEQGFAGVDALSIHEYWGTNGFSRYHALRHRDVHRWLDSYHPPMIITECGRDRIEGGIGGWQLDGVTDEQYLAELRAYDVCLQADDYVMGATPFTSGPTPDWWAFDTDSISDRIEGGTPPMTWTLAEQFPILYRQWVETGGDPEESFRSHLLGIGALPATPNAFSGLCDSLKARATQVELVGLRLPKA